MASQELKRRGSLKCERGNRTVGRPKERKMMKTVYTHILFHSLQQDRECD